MNYFYSKIRFGKLTSYTRDSIKDCLTKYESKYVKITIEESKKTRSPGQNRYYWGIIIPMVKDMFTEYGNVVDSEDVHSFLKLEVGKLTKTIKTPEKAYTVTSSRNLNTKQFEDYLEAIRAWGAEQGLIIPLPNEHQ